MDKKKFYRLKIAGDALLTAFQKKVLGAVIDIPKGEVRSYAWVGRVINSKAYRAVGQALKKNPYAPHVPCHRVISSDGGIGGYSGGMEEKMTLLKEEGVVCRRTEGSGKKSESWGRGGSQARGFYVPGFRC